MVFGFLGTVVSWPFNSRSLEYEHLKAELEDAVKKLLTVEEDSARTKVELGKEKESHVNNVAAFKAAVRPLKIET